MASYIHLIARLMLCVVVWGVWSGKVSEFLRDVVLFNNMRRFSDNVSQCTGGSY